MNGIPGIENLGKRAWDGRGNRGNSGFLRKKSEIWGEIRVLKGKLWILINLGWKIPSFEEKSLEMGEIIRGEIGDFFQGGISGFGGKILNFEGKILVFEGKKSSFWGKNPDFGRISAAWITMEQNFIGVEVKLFPFFLSQTWIYENISGFCWNFMNFLVEFVNFLIGIFQFLMTQPTSIRNFSFSMKNPRRILHFLNPENPSKLQDFHSNTLINF